MLKKIFFLWAFLYLNFNFGWASEVLETKDGAKVEVKKETEKKESEKKKPVPFHEKHLFPLEKLSRIERGY
jgi:hypothetical protein